jgi:hypothetical protein
MAMAWQTPLAADEARHHFPTRYLPSPYGPTVYRQPTFQPQPTSHTAVSVKEEPVPYTSRYHLTTCAPIPISGIHEATSIQAEQTLPKAECDAQTIYVNAKQFQRILKRRRLREALGLSARNKREQPYLHESRHRHAANRRRGPNGKFLSAAENAALGSNQKRKAASDNENDADSKRACCT